MDKINLNVFNLNSNSKKQKGTDENILGSLFSVPINFDSKLGKKNEEFLFPDNLKNFVAEIISNNKNIVIEDKNNESYKELFNLIRKQINPKKTESGVKFQLNLDTFIKNKKNKDLFSNSLEKDQKILKNSNDTTLSLNTNLFQSKSVQKTNKKDINPESLNLVNKIERNNDGNKNFEIPEDEEIFEQNKKLNNNLYQRLPTLSIDKDINKIKNKNDYNHLPVSNLNNKFDHQVQNQLSGEKHSYNGDKSMNFVLDNFIEQLNMSEKGWTEKLGIRLENALSDGTEEIELFLKPKELGSLKINLFLNKNNASIIFKAENNIVVNALQQNEAILMKFFSDQGINLENSDYLSNNLNNYNENFKFAEKNRKKNNFNKSKPDSELLEGEVKKNKKSNYIININA